MKVLIASDLHGSTKYIKMLLDRIEEEKPNKILYLGDLLYHGPKNGLPEEYDTIKASDMLNKYKNITLCVRGNCDAEVEKNVISFDYDSTSMILVLDDLTIFATHGHIYNTNNLPPFAAFDILLHGHTHIPTLEEFEEGKFYINPGSVSIPKASSTNSYIIYENRCFIWKDINGNVYNEFNIKK